MSFGRHATDRSIWWREVRPMRPDLLRKLHEASTAHYQGRGLWVARKMLEQNMVRALGGTYKLYAPLRRNQAIVNQYAVSCVRHALGLSRRNGQSRRWSYRNFYCIDVSLGVPQDMSRMIDDGLFVPGRRDENGLQAFHVTDRAIEAAGLNQYVRNEDRIKERRHG